MSNPFTPALAVLSMMVPFSAQSETFVADAEVHLAFADLIGPRGITLFNSDEEEVPVPSEAAKPAAPVTFEEPFVDVDSALDGRSIEDLIKGSPIFSPIEGLPEAAWKDKDCASCHAWTQETLCDQGEFYVKQGFDAVDRKQHPYGGVFKLEVMRWADRGCE